MKDYLISIVIPTKNRQKYCIEAIKQIISLDMTEVQIVIQDNSDDIGLEEFIKELKSEDIIYNYHGGVLSFVDNFSEAISLADGEYICMIGDDDGVLPNILEVTKYAKENQIDAIIPMLNAVYCWPSDRPFIKKAENGYLCLSYIKKTFKQINSLNGLQDLMRTGGQNYQSLHLPRVYHGIVKREMLNMVREKTGNYFNGLTPDIYMAVALALVCKKVYKLEYPFTISGICPKSGSADSATGKHTGKLEDAPHFKGHESYEWDEKAPKIYSVESIWAETVLHALKDFKADKYYNEFRVDILDSICLKKYPQFSPDIENHARSFGFSKSRLLLFGSFNQYKILAKKIIKRLIRKKDVVKKFYNVFDINEAVEITMVELRRNQL